MIKLKLTKLLQIIIVVAIFISLYLVWKNYAQCMCKSYEIENFSNMEKPILQYKIFNLLNQEDADFRNRSKLEFKLDSRYNLSNITLRSFHDPVTNTVIQMSSNPLDHSHLNYRQRSENVLQQQSSPVLTSDQVNCLTNPDSIRSN